MDRKEKGAAKHLEIMPRSVLKSQEFLGDQTFSLTSKNRIPGSVTLDAFVTDAYISAYELAKYTFAFVLHPPGVSGSGRCTSSMSRGPAHSNSEWHSKQRSETPAELRGEKASSYSVSWRVNCYCEETG
ncbi:MAG: hypothetical protein Q8Q12_15725 [bacterium]|nr:hypothetical protein [bacterium]